MGNTVGKAYVKLEITNMDEAKEKAAELVETLGKAKDIITQLNEMQIITLAQMVDPNQE